MDDLLQKQIRDSCKLSLPNGLQDLMSDISREVLRAQPQNLFQFITDYLASLLVTRENLFIGSRVCDDVCKTRCYPELEDELREIGLSDEDVEKTVKVVTDFFESGKVKETNLLIKLLKKTEIDETQLPAVLEAVRGAFRRHQVNNTVIYESSSTDSDMDDTQIAAKHTLKLYRKTKEPCENYKCVVEKIQAAYRAYNVRRKCQRQTRETAAPASPNWQKTDGADAAKKALHFDSKKVELLFSKTPRSKRCSSKASSISLAGSFVPLPPYKPYSIDDIFSDVDEVSEKEKEHVSFDYTQQWKSAPEWNQEPAGKQKNVSMKKKNISFHDLPQIIYKNSEDGSDEVPEEVEAEKEDADDKLEEVDEELLQEQFIKDHEMGPHHYTKPTEARKENKVLRNEHLTRTSTTYKHALMSKENQNEVTNKDDTDNDNTIENLMDNQVTPLQTVKEYSTKKLEKIAKVQDKDDDIVDEELRNEQETLEPAVKRVPIEPLKENTEIPDREDDNVVDEELTYARETVVEEEVIQSKKYETEEKGDENFIEELINEPMTTDIVDDEMIWYGDGYERKENSGCESRDDDSDNIDECLQNESAPASLVDLSSVSLK